MTTLVNVSDIIDLRKPGSFQKRTLLLCMAVLFMDGYDTQVIGYVAPAIVASLKVDRAAIAPVFAIGLVGLMIGSVVFGPLADRFGRKTFIVFCTTLFGLLSLTTAFAWSLESFFVLRFLTGIGLGGAMPNTVSLGVEYFPKSRRSSVVATVWVGFSIGAAVAGFVTASLLRHFGWPSAFVVGGVVPLALAVVLLFYLPESPRLLNLKGRKNADLAALLSRIAPSLSIPADARFVSSEASAPGAPVRHLLADGRAPGTLLVWLISFLGLMVTFLLAGWLPIAFNKNGFTVEQSVISTAMYQVGAVIGTLSVGHLMDRYDRFAVLAIAFAISACLVFTLSLIGSSVGLSLILGLILVNGIFLAAGGTQGVNALIGTYYPTFMRSTGVGWGARLRAHWVHCRLAAGRRPDRYAKQPAIDLLGGRRIRRRLRGRRPVDSQGDAAARRCGRAPSSRGRQARDSGWMTHAGPLFVVVPQAVE